MSQSVKKRSASHIYYGVDRKTGELRHIDSVPSGLNCECDCAACGKQLMARKGDERRHHFAHVSNYECMYASEVAIYKAGIRGTEEIPSFASPTSHTAVSIVD